MRSTPAFSLSALILGLMLGGCGDGQPWGQLFTTLQATFDPPPERIDAAGRLKTSKSFAVEIEQVSVVLAEVRITMGDSVTSTLFDPANPPDGYTLCHNGHCHSDDGRLVAYDLIELELAAGSGQGGFQLTLPVVQGPGVSLSATPVLVPMTACEGGCLLPRGVLTRASVLITRLNIQGRAFDLSAQGRLPDQGQPLDLILPLEVPLEASMMQPVDRGEAVVVVLGMQFDLSASVLDGVDFGGDLEASSLTATITENLSESEGLSVQVTHAQPIQEIL